MTSAASFILESFCLSGFLVSPGVLRALIVAPDSVPFILKSLDSRTLVVGLEHINPLLLNVHTRPEATCLVRRT